MTIPEFVISCIAMKTSFFFLQFESSKMQCEFDEHKSIDLDLVTMSKNVIYERVANELRMF